MVLAWYMDDLETDQRLEHKPEPTVFVSLSDLKDRTGVEYWKIDADTYTTSETLKNLRAERNYSFEDEIDIAEDRLPNYHDKLKMFFAEHIHSDDEIRFVIDGSGYFDVRELANNKWIRIKVEKNDMVTLPAGIYHRFTLDDKNYIKAKRYFVGEPVWTPINKPAADDHPSRKNYLKTRGGQ